MAREPSARAASAGAENQQFFLGIVDTRAYTAFHIVVGMAGAVELDPATAPPPLTGGTFNEFGFEHLPIVVRPAEPGDLAHQHQ